MIVPYHFKAIEKRWHEDETERRIREALPEFSEDLYRDYGYDAVAVYRIFLHPKEPDAMWEDGGIDGAFRFLHRFWNLVVNGRRRKEPSGEAVFARNRMIFEVTDKLRKEKKGSALSSLMKARKHLAALEEKQGLDQETLEAAVRLLAVFAPYISKELWNRLGHTEPVREAPWPSFDEELLREEKIPVPVQINGKKKGILFLSESESEQEALAAGKLFLGEELSRRIKKEIYVPGRILSFVIR